MNVMTQKKSQRLDYMDAMRGFAITLVVISHVYLYSFGIFSENFITAFWGETLILPIFFMISGYFGADLKSENDYSEMWKHLANKVPKLLISAFIFMSVYCIIYDTNVWSNLLSTSKAGYWYTFSLFEFIAIYTILRCIAGALKIRLDILILVVIVLGIISFPAIDEYLSSNSLKVYSVLSLYNFKYFFYFLMGVWIRWHKQTVKQWLRNGYFSLVLILLVVTILVLSHKVVDSSSVTAYFLNWILTYASLLLTLGLFQNTAYLSANNPVGNYLKIAGNHSLEIYFLHYYFVHNDLVEVGKWFIAHPSPTIELVCVLAFSIVVVALALILGRILCLSPLISKYIH